MKTKILKSLNLKICFDDGSFICADFKELLGRFQYDIKDFESNHQIDRLLKVEGISKEGIIRVSYVFDSDYEPRHFFFPVGEDLVIQDHIEVNTPKFAQKLQHVSLILESTCEEVEVDRLVLDVKELAHGMPYINGERQMKIPVEVGASFEAQLLKEDLENVTIEAVDGLNVTLSIKGKTYELSPFALYHEYDYGGTHSRYDYESWERFYTIRLAIKGAIQVPDRS